MSTNTYQTPFLRVQRQFPQEIQALTVEVNRSYVDIAGAVNARTIGIFPASNPIVTGESWFFTNQRQQGLRQIYAVVAGNTAHGINFENVSDFTKIYGTFTDGTNWYPLPYVDVVDATNQVNIYLDPTNIVITAGGGSPPTFTSGLVVLEWIANP